MWSSQRMSGGHHDVFLRRPTGTYREKDDVSIGGVRKKDVRRQVVMEKVRIRDRNSDALFLTGLTVYRIVYGENLRLRKDVF